MLRVRCACVCVCVYVCVVVVVWAGVLRPLLKKKSRLSGARGFPQEVGYSRQARSAHLDGIWSLVFSGMSPPLPEKTPTIPTPPSVAPGCVDHISAPAEATADEATRAQEIGVSAEDLRSRPSTPPTDEAINIRLGRTLVPRAGTEGLARWAATRRRHHPYGSLPRPGCAQGTIDALEKSAGMTARCLTEGCGALVDLRTARRAAVAAGRTHFVHGDGCASALCSQCPHSARFQRRQMSMADALLDGKRTLARRGQCDPLQGLSSGLSLHTCPTLRRWRSWQALWACVWKALCEAELSSLNPCERVRALCLVRRAPCTARPRPQSAPQPWPQRVRHRMSLYVRV